MKILHTSDWHVGRTLRGHSRASDHRAALAQIASVAASERVDLVLVVGDVFDSAAPTAEAEEIVYRALLDLGETGAVVAVVAGNHDNPNRLNAVAPLLDRCEVIVQAVPAHPADGGVREITTRSGEPLRLALLPFVSKRGIVRAEQLMGSEAYELGGEYRDRLRRIVDALSGAFVPDAVNVLAAHALVEGADAAGADRGVASIFDYWISPALFPSGAHYAALGDLHTAQQIPGPCPLWYSGAPLQFTAADSDKERGVLLVEAAPGKPATVRIVPVQAGRRLRRLAGTIEELEALSGNTGDDFLFVAVDGPPTPGLADQVRGFFPQAVEVASTHTAPPRRSDRRHPDATASPRELFAEYLAEAKPVKGEVRTSPEALLELFDELWDEVHASS